MTDCDANSCPQSRRDGEERRHNHHRRDDDRRHLQWCAKTVGGVLVLTSIVSVGASTTIAAMMGSSLSNSTDARIDAIRFDVNQLNRQIDRVIAPEAGE
jgi:transcriptional regulatory protein LevR